MPKPPNVVIMFMDDLGYADIGHLRQVFNSKFGPDGQGGRKFTDFYVTQAVCSASQAGWAGCYNVRIGILGALGPKSNIGINQKRIPLRKSVNKGYATACFGKWHLGHHKEFLPMQHGFDDTSVCPTPMICALSSGVYTSVMEERLKRWPHLPLIGKRGDQSKGSGRTRASD